MYRLLLGLGAGLVSGFAVSRLLWPARRRHRRGFPYALLVLIGALLVSACDLPAGGFLPWQPAPDGTLTIRLRHDVDVLNPFIQDEDTRRVTGLIFSGLVRLDDRLRIQPDLASGWEVSGEDRVWIFHLRPGLRWHDGTLLTAEDVASSLRLYMSDRVPTGLTGIQQIVETVTTLDSSTVRIVLRRPFPPLLAELAAPVVPRHLLSKESDPTKVALTIGSGPFRFLEREPGRSITLAANETYHNGRPRLQKVVFVVVPDEARAAEALAKDDLLLAEVDVDTLASLPPSLQRHRYAELGYNYVAFNLREGRLFADRNLRFAWVYGIDKEATVAQATRGAGLAMWSHIPPDSWAFGSGWPRVVRDVARARRLLEESGWRDVDGDGVVEKDGRALAFDLLVREDAPDRVLAARLMAEQLREVGMDARVKPADFDSDLAARRQPPFDFDVMIMGWNLGPDPDDYHLLASGQIPTPDRPSLLNYVGFVSQAFDETSAHARAVLDYEKRAELYADTQRIVAAEAPYYPLWAQQYHLLSSPRLKGPLHLDSPYYMWNVEQWRLER